MSILVTFASKEGALVLQCPYASYDRGITAMKIVSWMADHFPAHELLDISRRIRDLPMVKKDADQED